MGQMKKKQQDDRFKLSDNNDYIKCKSSTCPDEKANTIRLDQKSKTQPYLAYKKHTWNVNTQISLKVKDGNRSLC